MSAAISIKCNYLYDSLAIYCSDAYYNVYIVTIYILAALFYFNIPIQRLLLKRPFMTHFEKRLCRMVCVSLIVL